jgi:hypothetical protein
MAPDDADAVRSVGDEDEGGAVGQGNPLRVLDASEVGECGNPERERRVQRIPDVDHRNAARAIGDPRHAVHHDDVIGVARCVNGGHDAWQARVRHVHDLQAGRSRGDVGVGAADRDAVCLSGNRDKGQRGGAEGRDRAFRRGGEPVVGDGDVAQAGVASEHGAVARAEIADVEIRRGVVGAALARREIDRRAVGERAGDGQLA